MTERGGGGRGDRRERGVGRVRTEVIGLEGEARRRSREMEWRREEEVEGTRLGGSWSFMRERLV
jgi:hypothetical protein